MIAKCVADGVVEEIVYTRTDRNYQSPFPNRGNYIKLRHIDGSKAFYWHLRKNSTTVSLGDSVTQGQFMGLAGSSGFSTDAHLHFESGSFISGNWTTRDPWQGASQPLPSLWNMQEPYVGNSPLRIYDLGAFTAAAAGGNLGSIPTGKFKERLSQPAVMGIGETFLPVFVHQQGRQGDAYNLKVLRPDQTVFSAIVHGLPLKQRYSFHYWFWSFASVVNSADYGTWRIVLTSGPDTLRQTTFEVGATTEYAPRFSPIAGRSLRIETTEQRDTLRVDSLSGPVTYALINNPAGVSLVDDSIVVIPSFTGQTTVSHYFQAMATDGSGRTDTMWYHLVDLTPQTECPIVLQGDVDLSGSVTSADVIYLVNYMFKSGIIPLPCVASADVDCSAEVTSADIIGMVNFVFKSGPAPCDICPLIGTAWLCQ